MRGTPIGSPIRRLDAISRHRVRRSIFVTYYFDGMLYARMVRSSVARGSIVTISLPTLPDGLLVSSPIRTFLRMVVTSWS